MKMGKTKNNIQFSLCRCFYLTTIDQNVRACSARQNNTNAENNGKCSGRAARANDPWENTHVWRTLVKLVHRGK